MNTNNKTLTLKTNFKSAHEVCDLIKILSDKFRLHYRKGESVDLAYSQSGDLKKPAHNLAVWFATDNVKEVEYFKGLIEHVK